MRENLRLMAQLASRYEVQGLEPTLQGQAAVALRSPDQVAEYLGPELRALAQEQLRAVLLDTKLHVLGTPLIYQGGLNATVVRLADCFREAVRLGADSLILVHNHPSGDATPSPEDVRLTADAAQAGEVLGIAVLDHIVIGRPGFVSLRERGLHRQESDGPLRLDRRDGGDRGAGDGGAAPWPVPLPPPPQTTSRQQEVHSCSTWPRPS